MIIWTTRLEELKATVIEYIKDKVDEGKEDLRDELYWYGRPLAYRINRLTYNIIMPYYHYTYTERDPYDDLESTDLDILCAIADQIHLKLIKDAKLPDNKG